MTPVSLFPAEHEPPERCFVPELTLEWPGTYLHMSIGTDAAWPSDPFGPWIGDNDEHEPVPALLRRLGITKEQS